MTHLRMYKKAAQRGLLATAALAVVTMGLQPLAAQGAVPRADAPVQITYTYPGTVQKDLQLVQDALNTILPKKIGATIKLVTLDWGVYDQKMKLAFASGQPCDIVFSAPWINNYSNLVTNGDLLPLDDLLKQYAPKYWASMPTSTWSAARVKGKIYGAINQQMFPTFWGAEVRKDLAQKYKLNLDKVHTYADLEPFLATVKAKEPGITPVLSDDQYQPNYVYQIGAHGADGLAPGSVSVLADDKALKVFNGYDTPQYKASVELAYRWHKLGYTTKDPLPQTEAQAAFKAGKYAVVLDQARPGEIGKLEANWGYDFVIKPFITPILTTGSVIATMNAICRTSPHPDKDMQFLELINTDKQVYNLMTRGIEGKHYVVVDKAKGIIALPKGVTSASDRYLPNTDWMFGNQFNAYYAQKAEVGSWELQRKINATAYPSVALGFAVDTTSIKTQIAQVSAAETQYAKPLGKGLVDPAVGLPRLLSALKAAGEDKVIAEVQHQLTTWAKTK